MMKDIKNYEGLYAVTEDGRVWSHRRQKFMATRPNNAGYLMVDLRKDGKTRTFTVHRLVLTTFNPVEGMEKLEVGHKDENNLNNRLDNLEWTIHKDNCNMPLYKERVVHHGPRQRRPIMCIETGMVYKNMMDAERQTGVKHNLIYRVVKGERNSTKGLHWCYADVEAA